MKGMFIVLIAAYAITNEGYPLTKKETVSTAKRLLSYLFEYKVK